MGGGGCSAGGEKVLKQRCLLLEVKAMGLLILKVLRASKSDHIDSELIKR